MELKEREAIIAIARMCGIEGTNKEIFEKFLQTYKEVLETEAKEPKDPQKVIIIGRPF